MTSFNSSSKNLLWFEMYHRYAILAFGWYLACQLYPDEE